jgi:hypothetical protein
VDIHTAAHSKAASDGAPDGPCLTPSTRGGSRLSNGWRENSPSLRLARPEGRPFDLRSICRAGWRSSGLFTATCFNSQDNFTGQGRFTAHGLRLRRP